MRVDIAVLAFLDGLGEKHEQEEPEEYPSREGDEEMELRVLEIPGHGQVGRYGGDPEEEQRVECELDICFHNCQFRNRVINNLWRC